ncbi:MAG: 4Fe-4S binding protein [Bacteroidales bacterium]|nr:4Fe-4S binding protein [Bacteroidales bacterium]
MEKYKLKDWQDLPKGGVVTQGGNASDYETGTWRTWKPEWHNEECIHCLTCWVLCPEGAFILKEETDANGKIKNKISGINYYHCKGCGLCARECPVNKKGKTTVIEFKHETN